MNKSRIDIDDRLFTTNPIMFIRVSYSYNTNHPFVEFQRVYTSNAYELDTIKKAYKIQRLINRYTEDVNRFTQYVKNNQLVISLAL